MAERIKRIIISMASVAAGLCNSLIGAGGGIILSFCLNKFASDYFDDKRNIYVNSQASMIPGCALSCALYSIRGMINFQGFSALAIPATVGGLIGGLILPKIKVGWIKGAFALLVIWSGYRMMVA
jgi:uncharacterized membrane protein YfcA